MDVEKTIEFILDQQAKTETLWQRNEERWKRAEERMERLEGRQERFEKSLEGVRKLIVMGMKTLTGVTVSQKASTAEIRAIRENIRDLTAAQKRTDQKFERLVELLSRRNPNGHD
jgi:predicted ArsR family transcriptional regulator